MICEDCLDVCFMGLLVGMNYVCSLVIVVIFMGFGHKQEEKGMVDA